MHATVDTIRSSMFAEHSGVHGLICECDAKPIGFAVYFYNYSTWLAKPGLYLEDLYVSQEHRGRGAGIALLKRLATIAVDKGCERMDWVCLRWNTPSKDFYVSIGAVAQEDWVGFRMDGPTLIGFAGQEKGEGGEGGGASTSGEGCSKSVCISGESSLVK